MKTALLVCSLLALPAGAALAADNPWNGTWKLDSSRSQFTGGTFTVSKGAGSMLHYSDGSTTEYDFAVDGKERKSWANRTMSWTASGKNTWDTVTKIDGKVFGKNHMTLSKDGTTLTESWSGTMPDGTAAHEDDVMARVSGTDGLIGTWRATKVTGGGAPSEFVINVPAPGKVHYIIPELKVNVEANSDGSDNALTGPTVAPGSTISFQALSPTRMRYLIKVNGKGDNEGEQTIAADGHTFTDVNWTPGKEGEKTTGIYVKQ